VAKSEIQPTSESSVAFMKDALTTTDEVDTLRLRALIMGDFGSGKTTLAGTCPAPIILDPEGGTLSLRGKNIPRVKIADWPSVFQAIHFLRTQKHDYRTLFIDDLHEIQQYDLLYIQKQAGKSTMNRDLWGLAKKHGKILCTWLKALQLQRDMHVVVCCNSKIQSDDEGRVIGIDPDLQGGFREEVCRSFNLIGYLQSREATPTEKEEENHEPIVRRVVVWPYGDMTKAKDRYSPEGDGRSLLDDVEGGSRPGVCLPDVGLWVRRIEESGLEMIAAETGATEEPEEAPVPSTPSLAIVEDSSSSPPTESSEKSPEKEEAPSGPSPDELPHPDELVATIVGTFTGYRQADKDNEGEVEWEPAAAAVAEIIKKHIAKAGVKDLAGMSKDALALAAIIDDLTEWEKTRT
jgi:hypothetical protein